MKKYINYLFFFAAALTAVSCEDFLTKTPETTLSPKNYFSSKTELDLWANAFYNDVLPEPADLAELNADDASSATSLNALQRGTRNPSSKSWNKDTWKPLRNINYLLENNRCKDEEAKNMYDGVAYFFRAFFYFEKVKMYGDIPWYNHVINSDDLTALNKPRDPRGLVMLRVIQDLDRAYALLPDKWTTDAVYHVSKDAVLALKSRAALFEGTFRKYHAGSDYVPVDAQIFDGVEISSEFFLRQAADAAGQLLGKRKLYTGNELKLAPDAKDASYREYFIRENAELDETILARRYNVDVLVRHGLQFEFSSQKRSASQRLVNHYLRSNGQPIQTLAGYNRMGYWDTFQDRDPRMSQTLHGPDFVMADVDDKTGRHPHESMPWGKTFDGYRIIKFISTTEHENASTSTSDYPVLRYAEVLLNYAEAKAELGELTAQDIQNTIDVIRARVGMPAMGGIPQTDDPLMLEYYPNASGAQRAAILEIRRERTVELICEGFRQWDMLRWKEGAALTPKATGGVQGIYIAANEVGVDLDLDRDGTADLYLYTSSKPGSTTVPTEGRIHLGDNWKLSDGTSGYLTYWSMEDYAWQDDRDYLWPIPADQRTLTRYALTQNPGWDDGLSN